jgi:hypothetical protein
MNEGKIDTGDGLLRQVVDVIRCVCIFSHVVPSVEKKVRNEILGTVKAEELSVSSVTINFFETVLASWI